MVYVTGDIHGWLDIGKLTPDRWPQGSQLRRGDFLVICGDFGLLWSNPPSLEEKFFLDWLDGCPWTTLFLDGNHENFDLIDALPEAVWRGGRVGVLEGHPNILHLKRGQVFEMGRYGRWFVMGGATSHDIECRLEGESWWPRELPSEEEREEATRNLERVGYQVDYVFTHEVPRSLRRHAMARHFDPTRLQDDSLSAFLQTVDDRLDHSRLKLWYAGHYHDDMMLKDPQHAELYYQIVELGELPDGHVHRHLCYCGESWVGVKGLGRKWREWVLSRHIKGTTITWVDNECIRLATDSMFGEVRFWHQGEGPEVVELLVVRTSDDRPMFHCRFELVEALRAKELFLEMCEVLCHDDLAGRTRVLLCTDGTPARSFVRRLRTSCEALSLRYEFRTHSIRDAIGHKGRYDVVLVAPQVSHRHAELAEALPGAKVVDIPFDTFARRDVDATLALLFEVLGEGVAPKPVRDDCHIVRDLGSLRDALVITVHTRNRSVLVAYRVFKAGGIALDGVVCKRRVDFRDIEDIVATVRLDGIDVSALDCVGIALPGIVNRGSSTLPSDDMCDYDLGRALKRRFRTEVFVDSVSNATAMGCYMAQETYDSVVVHLQGSGSITCEQGYVLDGHLVKGRRNGAGEVLPLSKVFSYTADPAEMCFTVEGTCEVIARYLTAPIGAVAPDVIYVCSNLVSDTRMLRAELAKVFPSYLVPDLALLDDFRQIAFLGELALCVQKLDHPRPHRKW